MTDELIAHDIAADPNLFNSIVRFGNSKIEWECLGYTNNGDGKLIRFGRLVNMPNMKLKQINTYKSPNAKVTIVELYQKGV